VGSQHILRLLEEIQTSYEVAFYQLRKSSVITEGDRVIAESEAASAFALVVFLACLEFR
jgi:hypothetical protein